ncbi:MAG: peptidylprolyl isomerase, partial [Thermoanaerobaculia bacterium]|nr:peptidylprolyl isomerase [Thermoanaerobaculia bacterium]
MDALLSMAGKDPNATVRAEAIEALSKLAEHVPLDAYVTFTGEGEPVGIRSVANRFLFRFDDPQALEVARSNLDSDSMIVRREATYTFSRRSHPDASDDLVRLLGDDDALTRSYAARGLGRIGNADVLGHLLGAVRDAHPWVRTNALRAISAIAANDPDAFEDWTTDQTVAVILKAADDPDPGARVTAIETLGLFAPEFDDAETKLIDVTAEEPAFREAAATALVRAFPDDEVRIDQLSEPAERWTRVIVLRETSGAVTGPSLRARYADDPDASVRAAAIAAIPEESVESERQIVVRALEDPDPVVRANAIERAKHLQGEDRAALGREHELRARGDEMNDARLAALALIAESQGTDAEPFFRKLLSDPDPVVRRIAAETIEGFGMKRPQYTPLETGHDEEWYADVAEWTLTPRSAVVETVRGPIEIVLLTREAPITTRNFADLASAGYYDDTSFMRVVPNFVIQGGDPRNDMSGGPGYSIRDEINLQKYTRGAVGMALSGPDTGGSQFFITHSPQHHLDGGYTIFGRVTDGMPDVVDQIRRGDGVTTIRLDAAIHTDEEAIRKSAREPLPLEIGPITRERMLATLPEYRERMNEYELDETVVSMIAPM